MGRTVLPHYSRCFLPDRIYRELEATPFENGAIQIIRYTPGGRDTRQCHQMTHGGGRVVARVSKFPKFLRPYYAFGLKVRILFLEKNTVTSHGVGVRRNVTKCRGIIWLF
jgi:hypothetical protein